MAGEIVRVIFTGLCTFVGANVGNNHRPTTAVFPNATHHRPEHHVSLIVSDDDYAVETDVSSFIDTDLGAPQVLYNELGKPFRVLLLDGKTVGLKGVTAPPSDPVRVKLSPTAKKEHHPVTVDEMRSVDWIPSLSRTWPRMLPLTSTRRMRRGFFSVAADSQLVGASFELPNGVLASEWVSGDVWRFAPRSHTRRPFETATAQEVSLETTVSTAGMQLDLCDLETRRYCGYVRITKREVNDLAPIQVMIANVPDEDRLPGSMIFCGECGDSECELKDKDPYPCTCVDHHYSHYYEGLNYEIPTQPSLPRRVRIYPPVRPVSLRAGGGNCPPSDYP
jgi:hypothetical protein